MEDNVLRKFCAERSARLLAIAEEMAPVDAGVYTRSDFRMAAYWAGQASKLLLRIAEDIAKRQAAEIKVIAGNVEGAGS